MDYKKIKCVIFDLDDTLWIGSLTEKKSIVLKAISLKLIHFLDEHGILMSISSKNDFSLATKTLKELNIFDFFLLPQISYHPKCNSIQTLSNMLKIDVSNMLFIDDQIYELEEMKFNHPNIHCLNAKYLKNLYKDLNHTDFTISIETKSRRKNYQVNLKINELIKKSKNIQDFHRTIKINLNIHIASPIDKNRILELDERANKLRLSGEKLNAIFLEKILYNETTKQLYTIKLSDKFGQYGIVGFYIIQENKLTQLVLSCQLIIRNLALDVIKLIVSKEQKENKKLCFASESHSSYMNFLLHSLKV